MPANISSSANRDPNRSRIVRESGKISWRSPSNIALVKYWGKSPGQIPSSPSISMTLSESVSEVSIGYRVSGVRRGVEVEFEFEGEKNLKFEQRFLGYLHSLLDSGHLVLPGNIQLQISSHNSFPHSAGIASSASGFSALALGLVTMENEIFGKSLTGGLLLRKSAILARLGSGSATRSLYGGFVTWGKSTEYKQSFDEYGQPLSIPVHPDFQQLRDAILIVSSKEKSVSSSHGHALMMQHPYAESRFAQADSNFIGLIRALGNGNRESFTDITEHEALSLHALMMSSKPGFILMHPNTIRIIEKMRSFRQATGSFVCFTLDAGPNIHLIYPGELETEVKQFINDELLAFCEEGRWIDDRIGDGPVRLA
jgi:diphosphomevalonate decarboxylase